MFQKVTKVLNELTKAAVSARSEVEQLLVVLDGPAVVKNGVVLANLYVPAPSSGFVSSPPAQRSPKGASNARGAPRRTA